MYAAYVHPAPYVVKPWLGRSHWARPGQFPSYAFPSFLFFLLSYRQSSYVYAVFNRMASSLRKDRDGDRRAGELYHYFQPDNPAMLPARQGAIISTESPSQAKASPNLVLTALAQLAATKLGVQRAIIRYSPPIAPMRLEEFLRRGDMLWTVSILILDNSP